MKGDNKLKKYYANLIGEWVDITENATVSDHQDPKIFFNESLHTLFDYDHINIQYKGKNYRIHPSFIQVVTE